MTLDILGSLLGGLGLFLVGMKALGSNLRQLAGPRLRRALALATRGPIAKALTGLLLGGLTQSSSAVTFIATSLVSAGLLKQRAALVLLAWTSVGTAGLVMLATVDLRLAVLWLVGLVGFLSTFDADGAGRGSPALGALLGLALLFLGLDLVKAGAAPLAGLMEGSAAASSLPMMFLLAALAATAVQSSSTVTILTLALHQVGVLDFEHAMLAVYGATLGSGMGVLLLGARLAGSDRRLALFQALFKGAGALLFCALFLLEQLTPLPLVAAALDSLPAGPALQLGLLFLAVQLGALPLLFALLGGVERLLARLCPATAAEELARPKFLHDRALDEAATALELVAREEQRLLARLPDLLSPLSTDAPSTPMETREMLAAGAAVERATADFLRALRARGAEGDVVEQAVALEARLALQTALRETVGDFAEIAVGGLRDAALQGPVTAMLETQHMLLSELADLAAAPSAKEIATLRAMTGDRGEMMDGLRRRVARASPDLSTTAQDVLFRATALFERAVWLIDRVAALLAPEARAEAAPAPAPRGLAPIPRVEARAP